MSEGYYSWKANRDRLVREAEALGIATEGLSSNALSSAVWSARNPIKVPVDDSVRVERNGRQGRSAAARLVQRSGRSRFADPDGYANPQEAFEDLYGEVS